MIHAGRIYAPQNALYSIGLHESSANSLDIHEEDYSDMIHTNLQQDLQQDMHDDKMKQNLPAENCYLI